MNEGIHLGHSHLGHMLICNLFSPLMFQLRQDVMAQSDTKQSWSYRIQFSLLFLPGMAVWSLWEVWYFVLSFHKWEIKMISH